MGRIREAVLVASFLILVAILIWLSIIILGQSKQLSSLREQLATSTTTHESTPPSSDSNPKPVPTEIPASVKPDTNYHIDTVFGNPDSIIVKKYPYAIWQVSYNHFTTELQVTTYNGEKRTDKGIGNFFVEGDDEYTFKSSPPLIFSTSQPTSQKLPAIYTGLHLDVAVQPHDISFKTYEISTTLRYSITAWRVLDIGVFAGAEVDSSRLRPVIGARAEIRLLGR